MTTERIALPVRVDIETDWPAWHERFRTRYNVRDDKGNYVATRLTKEAADHITRALNALATPARAELPEEPAGAVSQAGEVRGPVGWIDRQLEQSARERSAWPDWLKASRGLDTEGRPVTDPRRIQPLAEDVYHKVAPPTESETNARRVPDEQGETLGYVVIDGLNVYGAVWDARADAESWVENYRDSLGQRHLGRFTVARLVPTSPESEASPDE